MLLIACTYTREGFKGSLKILGKFLMYLKINNINLLHKIYVSVYNHRLGENPLICDTTLTPSKYYFVYATG